MSNNIAGKVARVLRWMRGVDRLKLLSDELTKSRDKALAAATDVTDSDQVKRLRGAAVQTLTAVVSLLSFANAVTKSGTRKKNLSRRRAGTTGTQTYRASQGLEVLRDCLTGRLAGKDS